jgi:hypothetical protein
LLLYYYQEKELTRYDMFNARVKEIKKRYATLPPQKKKELMEKEFDDLALFFPKYIKKKRLRSTSMFVQKRFETLKFVIDNFFF